MKLIPIAIRTTTPTQAVDSFTNAPNTIGICRPGMSMFIVNRGQFSIIDAIEHIVAQYAKSDISLWTWPSDRFEGLTRLAINPRVSSGTLVFAFESTDPKVAERHHVIAETWQNRFGPDSLKTCYNHAKIATVRTSCGLQFLIRGSVNLNINRRFENLDITEGCPAGQMIREIENDLPAIDDQRNPGPQRHQKVQPQLFATKSTWKPILR